MGLGVTFTARDAMSGVLFRLQRAFGGLEAKSQAAIQMIGAGFGAMATGIAVVTAGMAGLEGSMNLASRAGQFEAELTRIGVVAQMEGRELDRMGDAAVQASLRTGRATSEVNKGIEEIAALGFSGAETLSMLNPALNLAAAGGISFASSAEAMGAAMKVFSIEATSENIQRVGSSLAGISAATGLQASDLTIALGTVGRGASIAKQDLNEVLIMMGLVKNTGVDATVAASSTSSALLYMAENAGKFRDLGIEVEDANGKVRKAGDIMVDLFAKLQSNPHMTENIAVVKDLLQRFGITAYAGVTEQLFGAGIKDEVTNTVYKGADALDYLRKKMLKFQDDNYLQESADRMLGTFDSLATRLPNAWDVTMKELGKGFKEIFYPVLKLMVDALVEIHGFFAELPMAAKKFGAALFVTGSLMAIAAGAAMIFSGAIAILVGGIMLATPAVLAFLGSFILYAAPIIVLAGLMAGAFVAFGAALYFVFSKNLGGATDKLVAFYDKWKLVFEAVSAFASEGKLSGPLAEEFAKVDKGTQDLIVNITLWVKKGLAWIEGFTTTFEELLGYRAGPALDKIYEAFLHLGEALGIVDGDYYRASQTMSKDDFMTKGALAAELAADAFLWLADAIASVVEIGAAVINTFKWIWDHAGMLTGAVVGFGAGGVLGAAAGALAGAGVDAYLDDSTEEQLAKDREGHNSLDSKARGWKRDWEQYDDPEAFKAQRDAERDERMLASLERQAERARGRGHKAEVHETKLYIDGELIREVVLRHMRDNAADTSQSGGYSIAPGAEW
jgi:TP901 family phage tail tape measure protein